MKKTRPTVSEMLKTFTLDEKNLLDYCVHEAERGVVVIFRTPMDNVTFESMTKDKQDAFMYIIGSIIRR